MVQQQPDLHYLMIVEAPPLSFLRLSHPFPSATGRVHGLAATARATRRERGMQKRDVVELACDGTHYNLQQH